MTLVTRAVARSVNCWYRICMGYAACPGKAHLCPPRCPHAVKQPPGEHANALARGQFEVFLRAGRHQRSDHSYMDKTKHRTRSIHTRCTHHPAHRIQWTLRPSLTPAAGDFEPKSAKMSVHLLRRGQRGSQRLLCTTRSVVCAPRVCTPCMPL